MEKTIEGFRKSQAKLTELERTNKKLQVSGCKCVTVILTLSFH